MAKPRFQSNSTPPFFQSKLLCFSLTYLLTSFSLAFYNTLSATKCLFRSSPFDPIQSPLFTYPSSYGEHKYALHTHRRSCSSPVRFSGYWDVSHEIEKLMSVTSELPSLRYMGGSRESFGGNFSTHERVSYFDHSNEDVEVPCGFFTEFPVSPSGVWRLVNVKNSSTSGSSLYENPAMNGVVPKYLVHRLFPNSKFSIWVDAKMQLMVDPLLMIHALVVARDVDIAISRHPLFIDTMEEAMATARWKKWWDVEGLRLQIETYCENGLLPWSPRKLPYPSDVPDSAIILRKHDLRSNLFSCLMFNELDAFNPRDQLPFAYVRDKMTPKVKMNMFEVEVLEQIALEYRHVILKEKTMDQEITKLVPRRSKFGFGHHDFVVNGSCCSRCQNYLLEMWGDSHN
ncbi:Probable hexosyltransferase MUCI70 [Linum perenne]